MFDSCLVCGELYPHGHHALPKSVWPALRDNPLILIPLCFDCHRAWHDGAGNVHRDLIPTLTWEIMQSHAAGQWLDRWYPRRPRPQLPF